MTASEAFDDVHKSDALADAIYNMISPGEALNEDEIIPHGLTTRIFHLYRDNDKFKLRLSDSNSMDYRVNEEFTDKEEALDALKKEYEDLMKDEPIVVLADALRAEFNFLHRRFDKLEATIECMPPHGGGSSFYEAERDYESRDKKRKREK